MDAWCGLAAAMNTHEETFSDFVARSAVMARIALQMSGHLRGLCESEAHFAPLERLVVACRASAIRCDLFVHTWDELYAQTSTWHTWYPTDVPNLAARSHECVEKVRRRLSPAALAVEPQPQRSTTLGNETWIVATGRHRETHVSLAGLRSAIHGVAAAATLREAHERAGRAPPYDVALRMRPDLYHRRNFRRSTRSNYRGVPVNQICSVPEQTWAVINREVRASRQLGRGSCTHACVRGCDDETAPGNKSGDMCFWSTPTAAIDQLVAAWEGLADEYLEANLCWQRWRAQQKPMPMAIGRGGSGRIGRGGGPALIYHQRGGGGSNAEAPPCAHPETQLEGSAAELMLAAAASHKGLLRVPLHGERRVAGGDEYVPRNAKCT